jgi:hypothetical protein
VALEWANLARQVPDQHLDIKRLELNTLIKQGDVFGDNTSSSGNINSNINVSGGSDGGQGTTTTADGGGCDTTMESFEKALRAMTSNTDHDHHHHDPSNPRVLIVKNLHSSSSANTNADPHVAAASSASIPNNRDISP